MSYKNSAGVKLNDATELVILADPDGTVESVFNKSDNTEYVGGGGGSSDFTTCTMTVSSDGVPVRVYVPYTITYGDISAANVMWTVEPGESIDFSVILWKGNAAVGFEIDGSGTLPIPTLSGAIRLLDGNTYLVTGDCSAAFVDESSAT